MTSATKILTRPTLSVKMLINRPAILVTLFWKVVSIKTKIARFKFNICQILISMHDLNKFAVNIFTLYETNSTTPQFIDTALVVKVSNGRPSCHCLFFPYYPFFLTHFCGRYFLGTTRPIFMKRLELKKY